MPGSSPRAWGTPADAQPRVCRCRFIPTCMGNSGGGADEVGRRAVHPHVHGELKRGGGHVSSTSGSSPRAWGTLTMVEIIDLSTRFIPTCMGNSLPRGRSSSGRSVHPQVHEELAGACSNRQSEAGSSPRAWELSSILPSLTTGLGSSPRAWELSLDGPREVVESGSSPRAWGTPLGCSDEAGRLRFIPTCMGNSRRSASSRGG